MKTKTLTLCDSGDTNYQDYIDTAQAALFLGKSKDAVWSMCKRKLLPHFRLNRTLMFSRRDLEDFMFKHRVAPTGETGSGLRGVK